MWDALTQPARLADWPGPCRVEPRLGGRFDIFMNRDAETQVKGRITARGPPRLLEFTWRSMGEPETLVRCELAPDGPGATRLAFTHRGMARPWIGLVLPGRHIHLERLGKLMATGAATPDSLERRRKLQAVYLGHYGLEDVMTEPPQPIGKYR